MKEIEDNSIDMILTDLPYGVLNPSNNSAKWDVPIDIDQLWKEYIRITKPNSAIVLFGQGMFTADLMKSNPEMWRYNLIWEKDRPTGFLNANRMPLRSHEDIMVFYRKLPVYNPQMIPCKPSERCHPRGKGIHKETNRIYGKHNPDVVSDEYPNMKFPRSILSIPREHECKGNDHPTQKPVALCEWLIKTYSNEGDTVLDSCMGSGTTGVACLNTNRKFIGIEKKEDYYRLAEKRLKETVNTYFEIAKSRLEKESAQSKIKSLIDYI